MGYITKHSLVSNDIGCNSTNDDTIRYDPSWHLLKSISLCLFPSLSLSLSLALALALSISRSFPTAHLSQGCFEVYAKPAVDILQYAIFLYEYNTFDLKKEINSETGA